MGTKRAPARLPPPEGALATLAPFSTASVIKPSRRPDRDRSTKGVMVTSSSHGMPHFKLLTCAAKFSTKASAIESCAKTSLKASRHWPLNVKLPFASTEAATCKSASGSTTATFLPANWEKTLKRCGCGCFMISLLNTSESPMKPKQSTRPLLMMGSKVLTQEPDTKLTTPGGKACSKAFTVNMCVRPPDVGNLSTIVLPMANAGIIMEYTSRSGASAGAVNITTPTGRRRARPRTPAIVDHALKSSDPSAASTASAVEAMTSIAPSTSAAASAELLQISLTNILANCCLTGAKPSARRRRAVTRAPSGSCGQ
mmetsp:Transcript_54019/g.136483  ORF Transcript_54019/g.136483 Transcript_54019/m.136483 type:complete len:313 (+) Transcript_54019:884-1822(+)